MGLSRVGVFEVDRRHGVIDADELVLDAFTPFECDPKLGADLIGAGLPGGMDELHEAGEGFVDAISITSGQVVR